MIAGSCHCGAVRIEVDRRPRSSTECNCSICRRYGPRSSIDLRMFDPSDVGAVRVRLLDGAKTWKYLDG